MKVRIGNKIVECDRVENGVPVIKAWGEEIPREDGGQDVIIHVPCMTISAKTEEKK